MTSVVVYTTVWYTADSRYQWCELDPAKIIHPSSKLCGVEVHEVEVQSKLVQCARCPHT